MSSARIGTVFFASLIACAQPSGADEQRPKALTPAQTEAVLLADGLTMMLPPGITAELSTVFETKVLTLRNGKDEVWVGLRGDKAECTVEAFVSQAKGEASFASIVRQTADHGLVTVVSAHHGDKGRDLFFVQVCPFASRAICGAEKLLDAAAVQRVSSVCGTLRAGDKPSDVDPRVGTWTATFVDDRAADRAAGRGGSGKSVRASFSISRDGIQARATYAVSLASAKKPDATAELTSVHIVDDRFTAAPIAIKTAWPLYLPSSFDGRFTPTNTLVVDGKTYTRER